MATKANTEKQRKVATPWGAAVVADEVRVAQRSGERRFATVVQLLVRLAHEAFLPGLEVAIMPPWATGGTIYNFSGLSDADPERVKLAFAPADYARLARAKAVYDPQNMFRINFNIAPAP